MDKSVGQIAYEAYRAGTALPDWDELTESVRAAWQNAASAVLASLLTLE